MNHGKETIKIQLKMKQLDDVFHRLIIALERYEAFLEVERLQGATMVPLATTAVGTSRDMHNDSKNAPNRDTFLGEVQLQVTALYYQTKFDDTELFNSTMKYFLKDILQWYGGRGEDIPYNEIDAFVLPIIVALSRQVKSVADIMMVIKKYVATIKSISDYSEDQRYHAVMSGWSAYQIAMERNAQETHDFLDADRDVSLTSHVRSSEAEGYKRLYLAMTTMFDQPLPAKVLCRTISTYLPEVVSQVPNASEENIESIIQVRLNSKSDADAQDFDAPKPLQDTGNEDDSNTKDKHSDSEKQLNNTENDNQNEEEEVHDEVIIEEFPSNIIQKLDDASSIDKVEETNQYSSGIKAEIESATSPEKSEASNNDYTSKNLDSQSFSCDDDLINEELTKSQESAEDESKFVDNEVSEVELNQMENLEQPSELNEESTFFTRLSNKVKNTFSKK